MSLSRVESKKRQQHTKKNKNKKRRMLWLVNLCIFAMIIIVLAVFYRGDNLWLTAKEQISKITIFKGESSSNHAQEYESDPVDMPLSQQPEDTAIISESENTLEEEPPVEVNEMNEATTEASSNTVDLSFTGDILQGEYIDSWLKQEGYSYPFQKALLHLSTADITASNLEMPITTRGTPAEDKYFVFKGQPEGLQGIVDAGIDIVSLANNHMLDQGVEGMQDTIKNLDEYGIKHMGAGNNDTEAYAPVIQEANGMKIAYFGVSRVLPTTTWKANKYTPGLAEAYDPTQALQAIKETEADITVVMIHWGIERESKPEAYQLELAKQFIDAGADLIIGSHPHVLQGFEQYKGKWIAYSLGNFVFASHPKGKQAETGVLNATCTKSAECDLTFYPMKIVNAQPTPVEGKEAEEQLKFLQDVSFGGVEIDERGRISIKKTP